MIASMGSSSTSRRYRIAPREKRPAALEIDPKRRLYPLRATKSRIGNTLNDKQHVNDQFATKAAQTRGLPLLGDASAMWRYLNDGATAVDAAIIIGALVYFICPIDAVPDFTPFVGYLDDAAVIAGAVAKVGSVLNRYRSSN